MCEWRLAHWRCVEAFSGVWGFSRAGFPLCVSGGWHIACRMGRFPVFGVVFVLDSPLCVSGGCHICGLGWLLCGRVVGIADFWIALVGPGRLCVSGGCHIACRMGCSSGHLEVLPCRVFAMCEWRLSHSRFVEAFSGVWGCFRAESLLCVSGGWRCLWIVPR